MTPLTVCITNVNGHQSVIQNMLCQRGVIPLKGFHRGETFYCTNSWKINTLQHQLGKGHPRSMGAIHNSGLQARTAKVTCTAQIPKRDNRLFRRAEPHPRGDSEDASKGGNYRANPTRGSTGFLLKPLSRSQEGRRYEASDKSKGPERVHCPTPFQNGGNSHPERPPTEERLDDQGRPKRRLLHNSNSYTRQTTPSLLCSGIPVPVHMPAIRPVQCFLGLHQDPEAGDNPAQRAGSKASYLHRRHTGLSGISGESEGPHPRSDLPARMPGICCPPGEDGDHSYTGNRVPGDAGRLTLDGATSPRQQTQEDKTRGSQSSEPVTSTYSTRGVSITRETECSVPGNPTGPTLLQSNTEGPRGFSECGTSTVRCALPTIPVSKRGAHMVERPTDGMEREESGPAKTRLTDRIRCISHGLGSIVQRSTDGRALVSGRDGLPHQLPGTPGSYSRGQDLPQGSGEQTHPALDRQSNSCCVHKQPGRDSLRPGNTISQESVVMVSRERCAAHGAVSPRRGERQSRHRVASDEGPLRLDVEPVDIPTHPGALSKSGDRSLRIQTILSTTEVLQLETRPLCRSNRRSPPGLEESQRLRQPTVEPNRTSPIEGGGTNDRPAGADSADLAVAAVVPQAAQPASFLPPENQPPRESNDRSVGEEPPRGISTTSRVAYLRQHYADKRISGEATDLLLSSWRQKSAQSYDSLCKKWISWCTERSLDPVSGPIEDVVNFLAHLHSQGYQYRSLNSYRSAIASMHAPVDGASIGQHPLVSRLLKGAFQSRPPLPRYSGTWDISKVPAFLDGHTLDSSTPLKQLTLRTVMLLALTRPSRLADLAKLNLAGLRTTPEGAVFLPTALAKQSTANKAIKDFFFPRFPDNVKLCPVHSLSLYIERTKQLRGTATQLFIAIIKPHLPVTSSTVARWLKKVIGDSGNIFKAHSIRGATTSAASNQGVTTEDILKAADWSNSSTFQRFYYKPVRDATFARTVLSVSYKQHN